MRPHLHGTDICSITEAEVAPRPICSSSRQSLGFLEMMPSRPGCNKTPARYDLSRSRQSSHTPGQIVIPAPAASLWMLIVTPTRRGYIPPGRSGRPELLPADAWGVIGCALRVAALADENGGSAGDVDTHWCGRARWGVWRGGLGCRWIVATSTRVCVLVEVPPVRRCEARVVSWSERGTPWRSCSTGSPVWMSARTR